MLCAKLASVQKEQFVMDLCSAPGGKSLYVADQLKGSGRVLSRDLTEYKTDLIEDNIDRVGFTNMESKYLMRECWMKNILRLRIL